MFQLAVVVAALAVFAYWWFFRPRAAGKRRDGPFAGLVLLSLVSVGLLWVLGDDSRWRAEASSSSDHTPLAVAVVFDTSLSMDAGPDPRARPGMESRLDRGKAVVLDVLGRLAEQRREVHSSVTIFTSRAETILHWTRNLIEAGEVIDRTIASDLVGRGGTDMGAAMLGAAQQFDALPARAANAEKVLLLVSDGETTVPRVDRQEHLTQLRQNGVRIVALHTGLLDTPEGIRLYDRADTFIGFDRVGGEVFTMPDVDTMMSIAGRDVNRGLYVRAESAGAAGSILSFIGEGRELPRMGEWWAVLGLWLIAVVLLQRTLT